MKNNRKIHLKEYNTKTLEILGAVTLLSCYSELHSCYTTNYLISRIIKSIENNHFRYYSNEQGNPIAFCAWVYLSDITLNEILKTGRDIEEDEYNKGDKIFFTEILAPFGHINYIRKDLRVNVFSNIKNKIMYAIRGRINTCDKIKIFSFINKQYKVTL